MDMSPDRQNLFPVLIKLISYFESNYLNCFIMDLKMITFKIDQT